MNLVFKKILGIVKHAREAIETTSSSFNTLWIFIIWPYKTRFSTVQKKKIKAWAEEKKSDTNQYTKSTAIVTI
jgi:hypothetical protein